MKKFEQGDVFYCERTDSLLIYKYTMQTWLGTTHMFQSGFHVVRGKSSFSSLTLISKHDFINTNRPDAGE